MAAWIPVPEPMTWPLDAPVAAGGLTYREVVLRAPTGEQIMKATANPGASSQEVTMRLIETVSGVPFDVIKKQPWHIVRQMSDYMDEFAEAPSPGPLEVWRKARQAALAAERAAEASANDAAAETAGVTLVS